MSRYVIDTEANELLRHVTRRWIVGWKDIDTGQRFFCLEGDDAWKKKLDEAVLIVGHNVLGYDLPMLEKIEGYKLPKHVTVHDTLIMSQVLNYNRFGHDGHSLARWGRHLGLYKGDWTDFSKYVPGMLKYCMNDIDICHRIYDTLLQEFAALASSAPQIKHYMRAEHAVSKWCAAAELHGWPFSVEKANILFGKLEAEINSTTAKLTPRLGRKTVAVDSTKGEYPAVYPKWNMNGNYNYHVAKWFGIDAATGQDPNRLVTGPYSRVEFPELQLSSPHDVKIFLYRNGWQPTEFNTKFDEATGKKVKTSGKVTEDSLEFLGGDGKLYCDYLSTKARYGILKGWLNEVDENGRLHGECFTIGTPSMRARHSIIANIPSGDAVWGRDMRELFVCSPGWVLVGCDSAGNQARGLAHYLNSKDYVELLLHGDIHQYNADVLTEVLASLGISHKVPRSVAKRVLYAFLFGASGNKMWLYIFGESNESKGKKLKDGFTKAVPGLKTLQDKLSAIFKKTSMGGGRGYIPGIAGNRIYCDSFHKLLVYLLQACEKATCGAATMLLMQWMEERGIEYQPCVMYHDEVDFMVREANGQIAMELGVKAFQEGPKLFDIMIMDGGGKIGKDWYEIH